jgi:hypothetical protein
MSEISSNSRCPNAVLRSRSRYIQSWIGIPDAASQVTAVLSGAETHVNAEPLSVEIDRGSSTKGIFRCTRMAISPKRS